MHVNRALEHIVVAACVDHGNLATPGIGREPQVHLGLAMVEIDAGSIHTARAELAREYGLPVAFGSKMSTLGGHWTRGVTLPIWHPGTNSGLRLWPEPLGGHVSGTVIGHRAHKSLL